MTNEQRTRIISIIVTAIITAAVSIAAVLGYAVPTITTACQ